MIIDPLSTAASAFAVASLAFQLLENVQQIRKFLQSIRDAPDELHGLIESIGLLHQHLDQARILIDRQAGLPDHAQFIAPLTNALASCEVKVGRLVAVVDKLQRALLGERRLYRKWGSLKFLCKKDEINSYQLQIRDANAILQSAILINLALTTTTGYDPQSDTSILITESASAFTSICSSHQ